MALARETADPGNQLRLSRELRRRSCAASEVVFAVEEERFTRIKHAKKARVSNPDELPWNAIRACLEFVPESKLSQLDAIAYSLAPGRRLAMVGVDPYELDDKTGFGTPQGEAEFNSARAGDSAACSPARRMIERSSIGFISCLIIARTPRAHSTHRRFRRRPFWWSTASVRSRRRGSVEARPTAWS